MSPIAAPHEDAIVVGSGPNGLVAAVTLAQAGWRVTVVEAADEPGGGTRTEGLTVAGFRHDVCSSVHPLAIASTAFRELLDDVIWCQPEVPLAHPLDGGRAALLERSLDVTCERMGRSGWSWRALLKPLLGGGTGLVETVLSPLARPRASPVVLAEFGAVGLMPATALARLLRGDEPQALLAGCAAHSVLDLHSPVTGGFGLLLALLGHQVGWPVAQGGSSSITNALVTRLGAAGGQIVFGQRVTDLSQLPPTRALLLDLTPRQVVAVAGDRLPPRYARRLSRYRYGPGVFKLDWALDGPVPWANADVARAGTVHLCGDFTDVVTAERTVARGGHPDRPFVLFVQATVADPTRAPAGKHTGWAYCHVPHGSTVDMTDAIERQVERFAPGFRDRILARHSMAPARFERYNANYVGGDIGGGAADLWQVLARPVPSLRPWRTPVPGLYLCSSSTPPGGGVHGMCGWHAANLVLKDAARRRPTVW
jgi:phytoene dehydrogenase-like protein